MKATEYASKLDHGTVGPALVEECKATLRKRDISDNNVKSKESLCEEFCKKLDAIVRIQDRVRFIKWDPNEVTVIKQALRAASGLPEKKKEEEKPTQVTMVDVAALLAAIDIVAEQMRTNFAKQVIKEHEAKQQG